MFERSRNQQAKEELLERTFGPGFRKYPSLRKKLGQTSRGLRLAQESSSGSVKKISYKLCNRKRSVPM